MMKLLQRISNNAKCCEQQIAYIINDDSITYGELWRKAVLLSRALSNQGKKPVIIYGHKSVDMIVSIIACLIAKRAYIPVETGTPEIRIKNIIKMSEADLIINNGNLSIENSECLDVLAILQRYGVDNKTQTNDNEIAYIIFTSGSTGEPKGVPISYENLDNFVSWISGLNGLKEFDKINVLNQASFSFDLSVADIYYSLCNGHTLVGLAKNVQKDYDRIFDVITNKHINLMVMTPSFGKMLLLNGNFNSENYPELKCMYFCGEPLETAVAQKIKTRFPRLEIINAYGPTEATSAVCAVTITDDMLKDKYLPVGNINNSACDIQVCNDEILLKGKSVFRGYLGSITGGYFKNGGIDCYRTGDCGYIENDLLYCVGRKDNQIKYMGYRIELGDIESNLLKIDGVKNAVALAKYKGSSKTVKTIKAYIVTENDMDIAGIKSRLSKLLPAYMIPKSIIRINSIPLNKNGKTDRARLEEI